MRLPNYIIFTMLIFTVGCSTNKVYQPPLMINEEASWAHEFVIVNGISYVITTEEVNPSEVGERLGEVKRNIVDMDTDPNLTETDFDSNSLNPGTALYTHKNDQQSILYKINNTYYLASQSK
ncbi:hypothetical protein FIU87_02605 [Bacillus sp. THAF10]|uniref:hypothetical protein n=1 Tax=Bacillus sp. THAF10 TaxID=2587848 RepID=UPI001267D0AC|nr:hypothetical protein [Bacillus sp. THAF10]QFT87531.1 hypothetical protein FIU87_02605 [Bacillus sp. THAF10]